MNLSELLLQWRTSHEDYQTGIAILQRLHDAGYTSNVLSIFTGKETSYTRNKLTSEIERIEALIASKNSVDTTPKQKEWGRIDIKTFPKDLQDLYAETISNLKSMDTFRGQLIEIYYDESGEPRRFPDEKRGHAIAKGIHQLFLKNLDNWGRLDYYKDYGTYLPGTAPRVEETSLDRMKYLLSMQIKVYDYLNKARGKVKKGLKINQNLFDEYSSIESEIKAIING
jgi:hypothetical protein